MNKMEQLLTKFSAEAKHWFFEEPEKRYNLANTQYQFFKQFFTKENLQNASWEQLQQIGEHLHTLRNLSIAQKNAFGNPNHELSYYKQQFNNLLDTNIPIEQRINNFKISYFGESSLGELLGYIFPEEFAIYNQRSLDALNVLNISIKSTRGENFATKFINFNKTLEPLRTAYNQIVGKQTDLPINLELDQFLSWVEETQNNISDFPTFWAVGSYWESDKGEQQKRFLEESIWEDGYGANGNDKDAKQLNSVSVGDFLVLKSSATIGPGHKTPITIIKNIGIVEKKNNWWSFKVKWLNIANLPYKIEGKVLWNTIASIKDIAILDILRNLVDNKWDGSLIKASNSKFPLNQILFGPPGTGKTYHTITKAVEIIEGRISENYEIDKKHFDELRESGQIQFITFHQNYSYEDFMLGIRPILNGSQIAYELHEGPFKKIADKARKDPENNYVLIIDEINRGNISKIFGELITLIEDDKREGNEHSLSMPLMYQKDNEEDFSVPKNLYIIGTMNTADKSIALVDIALRRRFVFEEMMPKPELIPAKVESFNLQQWFQQINNKITQLIDKDHQIGHSYFMKVKTTKDLYQVFYHCIFPLLNEYCYGNPEKLQEIIPGFMEKDNDTLRVKNRLSLEDFLIALQSQQEPVNDENKIDTNA